MQQPIWSIGIIGFTVQNIFSAQNSLIDKTQILDDAQSLQHQGVRLFDVSATATVPTEHEPSSIVTVRAAALTEYVRDIVAVLTRFTVERTHENDNDGGGGR